MNKSMDQQLNLVHLEAVWPQLLDRARAETWTYEQFVQRTLAAELEGREQQARARRLKAARIPCKKTLDGFDFSFQPTLSERRLRELADLSDVAHLYQCGLCGTPWNWKDPSEPGSRLSVP